MIQVRDGFNLHFEQPGRGWKAKVPPPKPTSTTRSQESPVWPLPHATPPPSHIDVGGTIYTSSLETLTNLKQHYFIDRDGKMFRHILNFLRTNSLAIPEDFSELELLLEEARFYDIPPLVKMLEGLKKERKRNSISNSNNLNGKINNSHYNSSSQPNTRHSNHHMQDGRVSPDCRNDGGEYQCLALNISPDLGERLVLSGERALVEDVFPEICQALMDGRSGVAWNQDSKHVIRFPLNGYCQQFSEYLFVRKAYPL
ncbi:KCTD15 [Cordylochernes scorpioides]|uniref:KCTD15 n=1 Tax=Cordylochernes scorpioides TaxID=51811 RepID=A0ABY6L9C8_9ARAC|nr:KCTD15 [Cordylochernes scorpioides]